MKIFLHVYVVPVVLLVILPKPCQAWALPIFVFVDADISFEIRNYPNLHKGDGSPRDQVLLMNVPCRATIFY